MSLGKLNELSESLKPIERSNPQHSVFPQLVEQTTWDDFTAEDSDFRAETPCFPARFAGFTSSPCAETPSSRETFVVTW